MLNFDVKTIPHKEQRYETPGDYWRDGHKIHIRISELGNKSYEFLVAVHELIELFLSDLARISFELIDDFDKRYEEARTRKLSAPCGCTPTADSEPGDDKHAPYYRQHQIATVVERLLALFLGVDWAQYDKTVTEL